MPQNEIEVLDFDMPTRIETDFSAPKATEDDAFRIYATTGARSIRRVARLLGLPEGTVLSWSQRHRWRQRIIDEDLEVTEGIADAAAAAVVTQQLKNIVYLSELRDNDMAERKDRTAAAKALMAEFKDISKAVADRQSGEDVEELEDSELERLAQSDEGVAVLLARSRARIGQ